MVSTPYAWRPTCPSRTPSPSSWLSGTAYASSPLRLSGSDSIGWRYYTNRFDAKQRVGFWNGSSYDYQLVDVSFHVYRMVGGRNTYMGVGPTC